MSPNVNLSRGVSDGPQRDCTAEAIAPAATPESSGRLAALLYGALPESASELVSYTVYRWECAVRASDGAKTATERAKRCH